MENKGSNERLAMVRDIYENRDRRARHLKSQGKKVIGYVCAYIPIEMITALDMVPYRILGSPGEAITEADAHLQTVLCPFIRSCFDQSLKGGYDFLDGLVSCHSCDTVHAVSQFWTYYFKPAFDYHIEIPHRTSDASIKYFSNECKTFMRKLEEFAGIELAAGMLEESILLHNQQRALVRELYELKKEDPPPISGVETLQLLVAVCSLPVKEGNALLRESIREVKERTGGPEKQPFRFLMWGSPLDDTVLTEMIEGCGVNVVIDDTCLGSRVYWDDVKIISDPVEDMARHYLVDVRCPRTFREMGSTYETDLGSRFGYIKDLVTKWQTNGAILQSMKYCDTHGYEVPALRDYLKSIGMPAFYLEHEYMMVALAPLKTRVQAFLEMLG